MDSILIVGDGNFSFSLAFAKSLLHSDEEEAFTEGINLESSDKKASTTTRNPLSTIYATSYDSEAVIRQDEDSWMNVLSLKKLDQVKVFHGIDATKINEHFKVKFKEIIFNFPHVGGKSNINSCRKLLSDFFESAALSVECDGRVYVSLCKGQGGTPCDSGRKGYGNSWQVATQASKAGFVLTEIKPFGIENITAYTTAGYRGQLGKGFHKEGSLTHVFVLKEKIELPLSVVDRTGIRDSKSLIKTAEKYFEERLRSENPYTSDNHPLHEMIALLTSKLDTNLLLAVGQENTSCETDHRNLEDEFQDLKFCSQNHEVFYPRNDQKSMVFCSKEDWNAKEELSSRVKNSSPPFFFTETFINSAVDISPKSYPIYSELVYVVPKTSFDSLSCLAERISNLIEDITNENIKTSKGSSSFNSSSDNSSSLGVNHYYPSTIPYFLTKIDANIWLKFLPDVTISSQENMDLGPRIQESSQVNEPVLKYRNLRYNDYVLSDRETEYFKNTQQSFTSCLEKQEKVIEICIDDVIVAKCGTVRLQTSSDDQSQYYAVVFCVDQLCMKLLKVEDIRLLWSTDNSYLEELQNRLANRRFDYKESAPSILYPLCYRHDLCFWMTDSASEKLLFAAIRFLTKGMVHSVRLLRILRHEETNSLSYCYRLIYSRCDGPLSHKETVELQNALRLALIDLKFELR